MLARSEDRTVLEFDPPQLCAIEPESVSIIIPVFNGATTITPLVEQLIAVNPGHTLQIVIVNDASPDGSSKACMKLATRFRGTVTFVDLARNAGEHNAVMAGLAHSRGDYCVIMDDDFQNPPEEAFRLVKAAMEEHKDIVFSVYRDKKHHWMRNVGSRAVNWIARRLMKLPSGLYLSSFKCLSRFAVDNMLTYRGPFPYVDGLALRATDSIGVLPTLHQPTRKERSSYTLSKLLNLYFSMAVNFSVLPLRLSSVLGFLLSIAGLAGAGFVIHEKFVNPGLPVGWPSLAVFVLFLSGVQLMMLGVLGEYLGQLVLTVNETPQYVVRSVTELKKGGAGDAG